MNKCAVKTLGHDEMRYVVKLMFLRVVKLVDFFKCEIRSKLVLIFVSTFKLLKISEIKYSNIHEMNY